MKRFFLRGSCKTSFPDGRDGSRPSKNANQRRFSALEGRPSCRPLMFCKRLSGVAHDVAFSPGNLHRLYRAGTQPPAIALRLAAAIIFCLAATGIAADTVGRSELEPPDTPAHDNRIFWVEGELLVQYRDTPSRQTASMRAATRTIPDTTVQRRNLRALSHLNSRRIDVVRSPDRGTLELMAEYAQRPDVEFVTPNYRRHIQRSLIPEATRFYEQWGLLNTGQTVNAFTGTPGADIGATRAWPMSRSIAREYVIAVIDTGVDYRHPDLMAGMWRNPGEQPGSGTDDDGNDYIDDIHGYDFSGTSLPAHNFSRPPGPDPMDVDGHGTHIAGIAAAVADQASGIVGVTSARIMALKASPDGSSIPLADSLEAMAYAIMMKRDYGVPVAVINASYGGVGGSNRLERDMIIEAGDAGIVVCAAAGNSGSNNDQRPFYPASYNLPNLIAVTGSTSRDERPSFANYGVNSVHLAAPGKDIISTVPLWYHTRATLEQPGEREFNTTGIEFSGFTNSLTAIVMDCGVGEPHQFPNRIRGKIALIERGGGLYFHEKVRHAMEAGAIAAIIYNHQSGSFSATLVGPSDWIPALAISRDDGQALREAIQSGTTMLTLSHEPVSDQAYDVWNGTSMATAFVSGAVTFMAYQFPDDTPEQRIARLVETVEPLPSFEHRVSSGGRLNMQRAIDRDADRLPDWWEIKWVGDLETMNDTTDTAGNGFLDWQEYRAGTDPTDPNDALQLMDAKVLPCGARRLRWASVADRSYRVARANAIDGEFKQIASDLPATPPYNTWTDSDGNTKHPVFYRVELDD